MNCFLCHKPYDVFTSIIGEYSFNTGLRDRQYNMIEPTLSKCHVQARMFYFQYEKPKEKYVLKRYPLTKELKLEECAYFLGQTS